MIMFVNERISPKKVIRNHSPRERDVDVLCGLIILRGNASANDKKQNSQSVGETWNLVTGTLTVRVCFFVRKMA